MDRVAQPLAVQEVLDRADRPEDRAEPADVEIAERLCPARLGIDQTREEPTDHPLTSRAERTPPRIARPHPDRGAVRRSRACPIDEPMRTCRPSPSTTRRKPRRGRARLGLRRAEQLRRAGRPDRGHASRDRRQAQVDRREPIPARPELLHVAARARRRSSWRPTSAG